MSFFLGVLLICLLGGGKKINSGCSAHVPIHLFLSIFLREKGKNLGRVQGKLVRREKRERK